MRRDLFDVEFSDDVFVSVTASSGTIPPLDHPSAAERVHQTCALHHRGCCEESSAFWFRDPGESPIGFIYTQTGTSGQQEISNDAQTLTCVCYQPTKSLNVSLIGTYYCDDASCGHIVIGHGTKLPIQSKSLARLFFF